MCFASAALLNYFKKIHGIVGKEWTVRRCLHPSYYLSSGNNTREYLYCVESVLGPTRRAGKEKQTFVRSSCNAKRQNRKFVLVLPMRRSFIFVHDHRFVSLARVFIGVFLSIGVYLRIYQVLSPVVPDRFVSRYFLFRWTNCIKFLVIYTSGFRNFDEIAPRSVYLFSFHKLVILM